MANFFDNRARALANSSKPKPTTSNEEAPRMQPWVEKYRPKALQEVTAQDHTITVLQRTLQATNLPHMLFYGPPGTGKTSTILALARELYGPQLFPSRVLELNASDERGISIVREKIKDFAKQQISNAPVSAEYRAKYPCPPFKIIVLDEADSMTADAQSALRRTMEVYSKMTRFCLCCNYVSRIIDPLASRCSKFRFKTLDGGDAAKRLREIAAAEDVRLEDGVVEKLIEVSEGDLRRGITYLQSGARLVGFGGEVRSNTTGTGKGRGRKKQKTVVKDDEDGGDEEMPDADPSTSGAGAGAGTTSPPVTIRHIEEIAGVVPRSTVSHLLATLNPSSSSSSSSTSSSSYTAISKAVTDIIADGWSATTLLSQLYDAILMDDSVESKVKMGVVEVLSECDRRLVDGADEHLCVLDVCLRLRGGMGKG